MIPLTWGSVPFFEKKWGVEYFWISAKWLLYSSPPTALKYTSKYFIGCEIYTSIQLELSNGSLLTLKVWGRVCGFNRITVMYQLIFPPLLFSPFIITDFSNLSWVFPEWYAFINGPNYAGT